MVEWIDKNNSNTINYTEFVAAAIDKNKLLSDERINKCFKVFDKDRSGTITIDELKNIFHSNNPIEENVWKELMDQIDLNGDGVIEIIEFKDILLKLIKS